MAGALHIMTRTRISRTAWTPLQLLPTDPRAASRSGLRDRERFRVLALAPASSYCCQHDQASRSPVQPHQAQEHMQSRRPISLRAEVGIVTHLSRRNGPWRAEDKTKIVTPPRRSMPCTAPASGQSVEPQKEVSRSFGPFSHAALTTASLHDNP